MDRQKESGDTIIMYRNATIDLFKLLASYMVVFIHVRFWGHIGTVVETLARFAVPLFFLVSGFYSYQITPGKIRKRIGVISSLLFLSVICYTFFQITPMLLSGNFNEIGVYFGKYFNVIALCKLLLLNKPVHTLHLWYLLAIIYVYILFYFVTKYCVSEKVLFGGAFLLLALQILFGECFLACGVDVPSEIVRNFALMGIPSFALGLFVKKHEDRLCVIPNWIVISFLGAGILESLLSRYIIGKNELYVGSLLILFAIVVIFIKYSNAKYPPVVSVLTGCSTYIYVFHMMISSVVLKMYLFMRIDYYSSILLQLIHPVIVCAVSTGVAYIMTKIRLLVKREKAIGNRPKYDA